MVFFFYQARDGPWELLATNKHILFCTACTNPFQVKFLINWHDKDFAKNYVEFILRKPDILI